MIHSIIYRAGIAAVLLFALQLAACRHEETSSAQKSTELKDIPLRLVSAASSNTEIIIGLGLAERLVAVDPYSAGLPGLAPDILYIDFFNPDAEALIQLAPDLVIASGINETSTAAELFKTLEGFGVETARIKPSSRIEAIYEDIVYIAALLGVKERGTALAAAMKEEVEAVRAIGLTITDKKTVYFEVSPAPYLVTSGGGTYLNDMLELIGAQNIFAAESGWFEPSAEDIIVKNPDVIFVLADPSGRHDEHSVEIEELTARPGFGNICAVQNKAVFAIERNAAARQSQHITRALRQMAIAAYPEYDAGLHYRKEAARGE
ncbi:ABC transporter substrate-binding protein [Breznakiellaceae bacterium SP9]